MFSIGQRLRIALKSKGFTLDSLSKKSKINMTTLSEIQNDKVKPRVDTLEKISAALNMPMSYFFEENPFVEKKGPSGSISDKLVALPVLSEIHCGSPEEPPDLRFEEQNIMMPQMFVPGKDCFLVRAKGDSMLPVIENSDVLVATRASEFDNGDIIIASVDGNDCAVRRIFFAEDHVVLQPENRKYSPIVIQHEDMYRALAKVIGIYKML